MPVALRKDGLAKRTVLDKAATTGCTVECCEPPPCIDCPPCECFVDDHFVAIPALDFETLDSEGDDTIQVTIPAITVTMPIIDCVGVGTYDGSPVGLAVVHPDFAEVTGLRITISLTLQCVDCNCVAYWCLTWQFTIYGDYGEGEVIVTESVIFHSMRLVPEVNPLTCEPAQTEAGDYRIIHCIGPLGADRLCCGQFEADAVCHDVELEFGEPIILAVTV